MRASSRWALALAHPWIERPSPRPWIERPSPRPFTQRGVAPLDVIKDAVSSGHATFAVDLFGGGASRVLVLCKSMALDVTTALRVKSVLEALYKSRLLWCVRKGKIPRPTSRPTRPSLVEWGTSARHWQSIFPQTRLTPIDQKEGSGDKCAAS